MRSIYIVLAISFLARLIYIFIPNMIWWDQAIYIAMGKYIFSHGSIGYWEYWRSPLWPVIVGIIWKVGLDPIFWGKVLEVIFSIGSIWLVYLIGEKIQKNVGLVAAFLLSFTPFYFYLSGLGLTDIPSLFFAVLAVYWAADRPGAAGLSAAVAFLLRFPEGLILVPIIIYFLLNRTSWKRIGWFLGGFVLLIIPYLLLNYFLDGSFIGPLIHYNSALYEFLFLYPQSWFAYFWMLPAENGFLIFVLLGLYLIYRHRNKLQGNLLLILLSFLIIGIYYEFFVPIKDLRYSVAFLPYLILIASFGLNCLWTKVAPTHDAHVGIMGWGLIILGILIIFVRLGLEPSPYAEAAIKTNPPLFDFYSYPKNGEIILVSSPIVATFADVKIETIFETWPSAERAAISNQNSKKYFMLNSCDMVCRPGENCPAEEGKLINYLDQTATNLSRNKNASCQLWVYQLRK